MRTSDEWGSLSSRANCSRWASVHAWRTSAGAPPSSPMDPIAVPSCNMEGNHRTRVEGFEGTITGFQAFYTWKRKDYANIQSVD